jgi:hypothetical protein
MPLPNDYAEFAAKKMTCGCGWIGIGAALTAGEAFGDGIERHCPACKEKWGFVQWSVFASKKLAKNWKSKIGRVEF